MAEHGHPKVDTGAPVFNYALAYDTHNRELLYYEQYPGGANDVSRLQFMLDKTSGYGYKKIGFILDRGCFSRGNIQYMDKSGYSFVIMVRGTASFVDDLILKHKGTFENKRVNGIYKYGVYGMTVKGRLYESDEKDRYFHLYHSVRKENDQRTAIEDRINQMMISLEKHENRVCEFGATYEKYFYLHYDEHGVFLFPEERTEVIEQELDLAGYFCIVTSEKMTAKDVIEMYKSRDANEKLFAGDKTYLGDKSIRNYTDEAVNVNEKVDQSLMN